TERVARNSGTTVASSAGRFGRAQNRLDLRREQELVRRERVVQRLDAEPIAREEQPPPGPIPEREGEHAIQALDAALAIVFVRVHDRLGVAARPVAVAPRLEARAQRG